MPRPKKTPEPAKRGPGRPPKAKALDPRVRLSPEMHAALARLPGGTPQEHAIRAIEEYVRGTARAEELAAYRRGYTSATEEAIAVLQRQRAAVPSDS